MALAVSIIIGVFSFGLSVISLIRRKVSIPSMSGIIWSRKMMSYCFLLTSFRHSPPLIAVSICICVAFNKPWTTRRFISTSSTTSSLASGARTDCTSPPEVLRNFLYCSKKSPIGSVFITFCGILTVKREPFPYSLSTEISPPIISTRFLVRFNPRPVPSILRLVFSSTLEKDSNSFPTSSLRIPIPVSVTVMIRYSLSASVLWNFKEKMTVPSFVYFTALDNRLLIIWRILTSSPYSTEGTWESTCISRARPLFSARTLVIL